MGVYAGNEVIRKCVCECEKTESRGSKVVTFSNIWATYQNSSIVTNRKFKAKALGPGRNGNRPPKYCHLTPPPQTLNLPAGRV